MLNRMCYRLLACTILPCIVLVFLFGCGRKSYRMEMHTGPHGAVQMRKVQLTPEEAERRNRAMGFPEPVREDLKELQTYWPKLTEAQKAEVLSTVKQMASQQQ